MFEKDRIESEFGATQQHEDLRQIFIEFAVEMDEILPDGAFKDDFFAYLKQSADSAFRALTVGQLREKANKARVNPMQSIVKQFPPAVNLTEEEVAETPEYGKYKKAIEEYRKKTPELRIEGDDPGEFKGGFE